MDGRQGSEKVYVYEPIRGGGKGKKFPRRYDVFSSHLLPPFVASFLLTLSIVLCKAFFTGPLLKLSMS